MTTPTKAGTYLLTSSLFCYLLANKKRWPKAVLLVGLGFVLQKAGKHYKVDIVKNVGESVIRSCCLISTAAIMGAPLWYMDENMMGKFLGMILGVIAGLSAYKELEQNGTILKIQS